MYIYSEIVEVGVGSLIKHLYFVIYIYIYISVIISPKFEHFGDIMFMVAPPPPPPYPPSPPPHANAYTGHNFVTNTPIKFIFAMAIKVQITRTL